MTLISAKFTGANGSLGFLTGHRYTLQLNAVSGENYTIEMRLPGKPDLFCPYCCVETFMANWTDIKVLKAEAHNGN